MKQVLSILLVVLLFGGCSKEELDEQAPRLISSIPSMGDTDVVLSTEIVLTFDENVKISPDSKIMVNDEAVDAIVEGKSIKLVYQLKSNTDYKVLIPEKTVSDLAGNYYAIRAILFSSEFKVVLESNLVTSDPIPQAVTVYNFLKQNYGVKSVSSIMGVDQCNWVHHHTQKYPAIAGYDFIFLYASWRNYTDISDKEDWWNKGGLVTISWHWNVPLVEGSTDYSYRYVGQQPEKKETTFDITKATTPGTWEYKTVMADLDALVPIFKKMQDKGIPVLWRPLHEASGAWFWWGAKGPQPCIDLWRMMFNHFEDNGVRNLIWIWTAEADPDKGTDDYDWYPGDAYVDMIGTDIYNKTDPEYFKKRFDMLQRLYPNRMISLSEYGKVGKFSEMWKAQAKWSFFMSWTDDAATTTSRDHAWANADWWDDAFAQEEVLTLDELPDLK
jgi:mannan endo-1,4-beta-mannosidase